MRRTLCTALVLAFAAASAASSAYGDIRKVKPDDPPPPRHAGIRPGKGPSLKELFSGCAAAIAANRAGTMIPLIWLEKCAEISPPAENPPAAEEPRIGGSSTIAGPGACSVVGEAGSSC
ncbi:MAG TPA: hypothetical protein VGO52_24180 [Hyphomonadaceae bacterium]|jgi:hypothetical protein|nr:hypothetical protein [Hyphomonadaceae bacterium]